MEIIPPKKNEKQPRAVPDGRSRNKLFHDRVTRQHMHNGDIQEYRSSNIVDQGIGFDQNGYPYNKEDPANQPGPLKAPSEQDLKS